MILLTSKLQQRRLLSVSVYRLLRSIHPDIGSANAFEVEKMGLTSAIIFVDKNGGLCGFLGRKFLKVWRKFVQKCIRCYNFIWPQ